MANPKKLVNVVVDEVVRIMVSNIPKSLTVDYVVDSTGLNRLQVIDVFRECQRRNMGVFTIGRGGHTSRFVPSILGQKVRDNIFGLAKPTQEKVAQAKPSPK